MIVESDFFLLGNMELVYVGGSYMDGIIPLWKPKGLTSHDCVIRIRKMLHTKKAGHTGTLDPEAEGVLPICVGQATKIVPYLIDSSKTYIADVTLGTATETEDAIGDVVETKQLTTTPEKQDIQTVLQSFTGEIMQIPPMYSAVRVNGKKLYEYARAGETVERPKRMVRIMEATWLDNISPTSFRIQIRCSKGTYIRTLCVDIGGKLGYPAHMSDLIRISTGNIHQEETVTFTQIQDAVEQQKENQFLLPITRGLTHLDSIIVSDKIKKRVLFGQKLEKPKNELSTDPFTINHEGHVLAIYQINPKNSEEIKPVRVFS